jgi:tellurite resistance protein TerC
MRVDRTEVAATPGTATPRTVVGAGVGDRRRVLALTPLALALLMVDGADVVFAVDSIPAIFAITGDPFLIFTSNVFAMPGLRSLSFALAGMVSAFHHLKTALALVLVVVGLKMLAAEWLKHSLGAHFNLYLLGLILAIITGGVVTSLLDSRPVRAAWNRRPRAAFPD